MSLCVKGKKKSLSIPVPALPDLIVGFIRTACGTEAGMLGREGDTAAGLGWPPGALRSGEFCEG